MAEESDKKVGSPRHIAIIGAGLAGTMMAAMLNKLGFKVSIFEKRSDNVEETISLEFGNSTSATKRSINLSLSYRGMQALEEMKLLDKVLETAIRMPCRVIHNKDGSIKTQAFGTPDQTLWSVGRGTLNQILRDHLQAIIDTNQQNDQLKDMLSIHFGYYLADATPSGTCTFHDSHGNHLLTASYDLIIGADGAFSAVREALLKCGRVNFSRNYIRHGYKELTIPPIITADGQKTFALPHPEGLHLWPRGDFLLLASPNPDYTFTATLFAPYAGFHSFDMLSKDNAAGILSYFQTHFPDILPTMPNLLEEFQTHPVGSLQIVRTDPWYVGKILLIGDAAHAVVPFYGQGMNAAFQDATLFTTLLKQYLYEGNISDVASIDLAQCAKEFAKERILSTNALADICMDHYYELARYSSSSTSSFWRTIPSLLITYLPEQFMPLYSMLAFTDIPYEEAIQRSKQQRRWVQGMWIMSSLTVLTGLIGYYYRDKMMTSFQTVQQSVQSWMTSIFPKKK